MATLNRIKLSPFLSRWLLQRQYARKLPMEMLHVGPSKLLVNLRLVCADWHYGRSDNRFCKEDGWRELSITVSEKLKPLKRTITPYLGQSIMFLVITIFSALWSYKISDWGPMWAVAVIWASFAVLIRIGLQYRVLWDENGLAMRASGLAERRIAYDEITHVKMERAASSEFFSQARPFRRIVVYGRKQQPGVYIDISLRHFEPRDIDELLAVIRERRPDLSVPVINWGTGFL